MNIDTLIAQAVAQAVLPLAEKIEALTIQLANSLPPSPGQSGSAHDQNEWLTLKEFIDRYGETYGALTTLRSMCAANKLAHSTKPSGQYLIRLSDVLETISVKPKQLI